ncbi:diguanylate cyclase [Comamonas sp. CMM02]|uniref:GGDEF domain-containing protein n=1 Tax=Comamonas sp. CMM02 TaxID=2769307 RepID=UPI001781679C|nr:GGDEF domain-containing protein [Comamonas sp. CMM02]MBD9402348.1 GGDEF domain-containing protein [Comamonas sp. CMM02]
MPINNAQAYLLVAPSAIVMLSLALFTVWYLKRDHRYLLLLGCSLAFTGVSLGFQTLLDRSQIATWSTVSGLGYLLGAWFGARALADKYGVPSHPRLSLAIGLTTLAILAFFSLVEEDLLLRIHALGIALGLMQVLPAPAIFKLPRKRERLEVVLYWIYVMFCIYTMLRPAIVLAMGSAELNNFVLSKFWVVTTIGSMTFCMLFTFLFLACAVQRTVSKLSDERDHDPLTELLNRRAFLEAAESLINDRRLQPISLAVGDIDHFKYINDRWGHERGDQVLKKVSLTMRSQVRDQDLVARYGGEEFVLLLVNTDIKRAGEIVARIREQVRSANDAMQEDKPLTISFGITAVPLGGSLSAAIDQADKLLYQAKGAGRDRICTDPVAESVTG